jgi:peroxiredoxin Q/BCP
MKNLILSAAVLSVLLVWLASARGEPLAVGAKAPLITAADENGKTVDFGKVYRRGITLVYFYPKADTPGCTAEACSLRDSITDLRQLGITVIGVSHDTAAAQKKFKEKYDLPFTLIADPDRKVSKAFGVPTMVFGMAKRQSFLVKDGKIAWRSLSAQTGGHAAEVSKAVASLK